MVAATHQAWLIAIELDGQLPQAGVLAAADAVLDPGVGAVAGLQEGQLPARGVGGERAGSASRRPPRTRTAGPRVRAFPPDDDPHVGRPVSARRSRRCGAARSARPPRLGHLRGPWARRRGPRRSPTPSRAPRRSRPGRWLQVEPDRVVHAAPVHAFNAVMWCIRSLVAPAPSQVISRSRRYGSGIWVIASSSTAMWSDAVLSGSPGALLRRGPLRTGYVKINITGCMSSRWLC